MRPAQGHLHAWRRALLLSGRLLRHVRRALLATYYSLLTSYHLPFTTSVARMPRTLPYTCSHCRPPTQPITEARCTVPLLAHHLTYLLIYSIYLLLQRRGLLRDLLLTYLLNDLPTAYSGEAYCGTTGFGGGMQPEYSNGKNLCGGQPKAGADAADAAAATAKPSAPMTVDSSAFHPSPNLKPNPTLTLTPTLTHNPIPDPIPNQVDSSASAAVDPSSYPEDVRCIDATFRLVDPDLSNPNPSPHPNPNPSPGPDPDPNPKPTPTPTPTLTRIAAVAQPAAQPIG